MRAPWSPAPRRHLTASAARITTSEKTAKRLGSSWQNRSFFYYDNIGEIWYASQFYSRSLSKLELPVQQKDEEGEWVECTDQTVLDAWERVQDPDSEGRSKMLANYGRIIFLTGETRLICYVDPLEPADTTGDAIPPEPTPIERWEIVSSFEITMGERGTFTRHVDEGDSAGKIEYKPPAGPSLDFGEGVVYRLWRPHPKYSRRADSPMRAVQDICEELLVLTYGVRNVARSRVTGPGILWIPDEIDLPAPDAGDDDDDPFLTELTEAMVKPIADETSAAAVVPYIARGPAEAIKAVTLTTLRQATDSIPEAKLREEAIGRLALGLDLPPEILEGLADSNHWTGWLIDEQTWTAHVEPIAEMMVQDFTAIYLRPMLRDLGVAQPEIYRVYYDETEVVQHPERGQDAKDVFDRGGLSWEALRAETGFQEDDAPSEDELRLRADLEGRGAQPVDGGTTTDQGPPDQQASMILQGAGLAAISRCREIAGSRLRTRIIKANMTVHADVTNSDLAAHLGRPQVDSLWADDLSRLVHGGSACFIETAQHLGFTEPYARAIARGIELEAVRTLFDADGGGVIRQLVANGHP